uniref:EF-hand domain-containing protein n=1 Tax=Eutreptiella gymnastica TaxID=73025 RepID=A0A7S4GM22_9EUGL
MFDTTRTGELSKEDYLHCLRACGQRPTQKDADAILNSVGSRVTMEQFLAQMQKGTVGPTEQQLYSALHNFDMYETGSLNRKDLFAMLTTLGDALTPEEAARVFEEFGPADPNGCLDIKTVMAKLTQPVPTRHPTMEGMAAELGIKM